MNCRFLALVALVGISSVTDAFGLPAFAIREKMSCTMCHTNGSAPHLTQAGYLYRRAGFRWPAQIGNKAVDEASMDLLKHFVAGVNIDYNLVTQKPQGPGADQANTHAEGLTQNNFDVREAEIWPLVGGFFGNYGAWVELDMTPGSVPANTNTGMAGGSTATVALTLAEMRFVDGNQDFFYGIRAGIMGQEGYGASDQWIDDGAIPLFDTMPAVHSATGLNTLALPLGAMNIPQFGIEFAANWPTSFLTLGIYNGYDGTTLNNGTPQLNPAQMNTQGQASKDVKLQLDQMFDRFALTATYYNGRIALLDPTNTFPWQEWYQTGRLYGTFFMVPNVVDLMAGAAVGQYGFVEPGGNTISGYFNNVGTFAGANYYVKPHLTLSARLDYYQYDTSASPRPVAQAASLLASLPYENNIWVFHLIRTEDTLNGLTNDFRAEWRFLFLVKCLNGCSEFIYSF